MADHIKINPAPGIWSIRAGGAVLGETRDALELVEGGGKPVIYFPRDGLAMMFLEKTDTTSTCPWKGDATYYSIVTESETIRDAAWSYETPNSGMEAIKDHLAFYPSKVTIEEL